MDRGCQYDNRIAVSCSDGIRMKEIINRDDVAAFRRSVKRKAPFSYYDYLVEETGKAGALNIMRYIVENDIWCRHANDEIALFGALQFGRIEMVKFLIDVNVNLTCRNNACLHMIMLMQDTSLIDHVVSELANRREIKETLLCAACASGLKSMVSHLLQLGAQVSYMQDLPYLKAIESKSLDVFKCLLEVEKPRSDLSVLLKYVIGKHANGIFKFMYSDAGRFGLFELNKLLSVAVSCDNTEICEFLVEKANADPTVSGYEPVVCAIEFHRNALVTYFFDHIGRFDMVAAQPLFQKAIKVTNYDAIKLIIEKLGENPVPYQNVLLKATREGNSEICEKIMADYHREGQCYAYFLDEACTSGNLQTVKLFLDYVDGWKTSIAPLYSAARAGHLGIVKYLIENGGDISIFTPERIGFIDARHQHVISYLKDLLCMNENDSMPDDDDDDAAVNQPIPPPVRTPNPPARDRNRVYLIEPVRPPQHGRPVGRDLEQFPSFGIDPPPQYRSEWNNPRYPDLEHFPIVGRDPPNPHNPRYPDNPPPPPPRLDLDSGRSSRSTPNRRKEPPSSNIAFLRAQILTRLQDDDECPVCLEKLKTFPHKDIAFWPGCEHMVCKFCIKELRKCPVCRSSSNS